MSLIWITGLANSGKTTLAKFLYKEIKKKHKNTVFLDGDILRKILDMSDRSYSESNRKKLSIKYSKFCKFLSDQDLTVIISTISMFEDIRKWNRKNNKMYFEIYVKASKKLRLMRDDRKIYKKADTIKEFNDIYQEPSSPDFVFNGMNKNSLLQTLITDFLND